MSSAEKPDADRFREHLKNLKNEKWLGEARKWWPSFLFHHTNITNVVSILKSGRLASRISAKKSFSDFVDAASTDIIAQTDDQWKRYVRFYFRPKTPTFYLCEGFRPVGKRQLNAHCPVPVYLLFDSETILCRADSRFSKGNLGRHNSRAFSKASDFEQLPFRKIYHDGSMSEEEKSEIKNCRHAEVIVPDAIDLRSLRRIWCRSQAEIDTLRYLMGDLWPLWQEKVTARTDYSLFNREWTYVDRVDLRTASMSMHFNIAVKESDKGPFKANLEIINPGAPSKFVWVDKSWVIGRVKKEFDLTNLPYPSHYIVKFYLNDELAYSDEYTEIDDDIPF